jgi:hypothetical protein
MGNESNTTMPVIPLEVDTNIIQVITREEFIEDQFRKPLEPEKKQVLKRGMKSSPKNSKKIF